MELAQASFLNILRCTMTGEPVSGLAQLTAQQWNDIVGMARMHKVLPLVSDAVYRIPEAQPIFGPLKPEIRRQVMGQAQRTHGFLELNRRLREAGVETLVVKGIVCRSLYPKGDLRLSADEDLLAAPGQLERARAVLEEAGLVTGETAPEAYEYPYRSPNGLQYIELHASLFPPEAAAYGLWNEYFRDVFHRAEILEIQGEPVRTMAPTDHLLYLILHAFKHFLHSGVGIRQVCDIAMGANAWGSRVDWNLVADRCRELRATGFLKAVLAIAREHLGLEASAVPEELFGSDGEPLLEDMLAGGVYGGATMSRKHSSNMTLDAVAAQQTGKTHGGVLGSLFPRAEKLEGKYPYLKKNPWLVPVAWADRIVHYAGELKQDPGTAAETVASGNHRLELLRHYGVID